MRILIVHNFYQQPGGEDVVVEQEAALLQRGGHTVIKYYRTNDETQALSLWGKAGLPKQVIWASDTVRGLSRLIEQQKPDIVHFHNTFLMISPAAYYACQRFGLPVVQTLHNYRLLCPAATFFRSGQICEDCLNQTPPWPGVFHACYRHSSLQTGMAAAMLTFHRWLKTWQNQVDLYITPTEFARRKFIQGGIPSQKIRVKPNFVDPDPGIKANGGDYFLFIGRLSSEKGVQTLLKAWQLLTDIPLKIVGDGPLRSELQSLKQIQKLDIVEILGQQSPDQVTTLMKKARCVIFPSILYETFGRVIIEAFACGVPVIASQLGAVTELVENERTGLYFSPGNPEELANQIHWAWTQPQRITEMGRQARQEYELKYTAELNYKLLTEIYQQVIDKKTNSSSSKILESQ